MRNTNFLAILIDAVVPFAVLKIGLIISLVLVALTFANCSTARAQSKSLNGKWRRYARHYGADLKITKASKTRFNFVLTAANGANMGAVSGAAFLKKGKFVFTDAALAKREKRDVCELVFAPRAGVVEVSQNYGCQNYAGNAVSFDGDFLNGVVIGKADSLFAYEVFPNSDIDSEFKTLTGANYEKFLDAFHLIYDDTPNEDAFAAKVFNGCVRGICPYQAAIIMYDENAKFWAMVTGDGEQFLYFSNDNDFRAKLPKTIEKWQTDLNPNAKITYQNRK